MSGEKCTLQFVPVSSFIQAGFWNKLSEIKINVDKLNEGDRKIWGYFSNVSSTWTTHVLEVDSTSFNANFDCRNNSVPFHGTLFNKNTIEQFKECDKSELLERQGRRFLEEIRNGAILETPSKLNFFFILSFSDLKKYHFYYWFAFPVLHNLEIQLDEVTPITSTLTETQIDDISRNYQKLSAHQKAYFLIQNLQIYSLKSKISEITTENSDEFFFAFADYSNSGGNPKSQLKNYVILVLHHCPHLAGRTVKFLLFFLNRKLSCSPSLFYQLTLPSKPSDELTTDNVWVGWEKNEKSKFAPRFSNMKATMDPKVLFEESVDLNLKLMKWRLLPDIDLDKIKNTKCLLLGAGTLGCSVARTLLGWGVRNISFVDNSTVSFSNPVRQSLFTYEDSIGSKPKAQAAADNLKKIFPGINSQGFDLTIPMPGHSVGENSHATVKASVATLETLVGTNDIIFLLTDSRESRWLPTLLAISMKKTVINCALGFDSYLVMRYGSSDGTSDEEPTTSTTTSGFKRIPGHQLGCYFCNDVTAPGNSLKDRTLDQQCTVTRPGVSAIAGALAVELAISVTQHKLGIGAPAFYRVGPHAGSSCEEELSSLGLVPHSVRGFLSDFSHVLPATPKYNQCIACSNIVLEEFQNQGFEFLLKVFNGANFLEDLTGLSALQEDHNFDNILEISDDDDWQD